MKLKTALTSIVIITLIMFVGNGCKKSATERPSNQCDTTNTTFNELYDSLVNSPVNINDTTMDTELHSYTFQVISPETICKVGYQNTSPTNTQPYLIEIYDSASNTLLYSGTHIFSSTNTSYVAINPVPLTVGRSYTIKRIQNMTTLTSDLIGRLILNYNHQVSFPVTLGNLKITSTSFSSSPNALPNAALPYIDVVFE